MKFEDVLGKQVLVLDGAMGTMVQNLELEDQAFGGAAFKMLTDLLVFSRPDDLKGIHLKYLRAGANLVETNTFGASPLRLKEFDFTQIDLTDIQAVPEGLDLKKSDYAAIAYYLNLEGCRIARKAVDQYKSEPEYDGRPLFVAGSIGPSNYVLSKTEADLNKATWDQVVDNNFQQAKGMIEGNADVLLFETQQDILELKASICGANKAFEETRKQLPVIAQVTVDGFSKMQIFNTDIHAALVAVEGMGICAFGINCNTGPELMEKTVEKLSRVCRLPISIVPNAGQPVSEDGKTCYKLEPENMADYVERFVKDFGVSIIGGCCGTTPDHILAISKRLKGLVPNPERTEKKVFVSGPQEAVSLDSSEALIRIGERLNVRGSKKVREAVERDDEIRTGVLEEVVEEQVKDLGIDIIDVCMDSNIVGTEQVLPQVVYELASDFKGAMCIDSFSVEALKAAIESYPGRPIINSISLEEHEKGVSKLDAVLSLTRQHHPVYVALVNGPEGPGQTADEKYELAAEIVKQAREKYNVMPGQILMDVNAYPIGSESIEGLNFCAETLKCLPRIKAIHPDLKTSIGVGNLTNGLASKPYMRKVLTSVFLDEARKAGLDCAILNPSHYVPLESLTASDVAMARKIILDRDMTAFEELEKIAQTKKTGVQAKKINYDGLSLEESICRKIKDGFKQKQDGVIEKAGGKFAYAYKDQIVNDAAKVVEKHEPLSFISGYLMKAMRELGDAFGRGEVSLPHLLKSADVMRHVMQFLEGFMRFQSGAEPGAAVNYKGVVIIGTVYQDVHSIGKDLARTLLENYGYRVVDLGVQVPLEKFVETARVEKADAIGMSALLVQTSNHMITVARMLAEEKLSIPVLIGGAPVNLRHAGYVAMKGKNDTDAILDNVFYCGSGMDGVNTMGLLMDKEKRSALLKENRKALLIQYQKAKGIEEEKEKLLETLPRRKVSFRHHEVPAEGYGTQKVEFKLHKLSLDRKSLYSLNWKFGKKSSWIQKGITLDQLQRLEKEWIKKAEQNRWIIPMARFGLFPAQSDGDEVVFYESGKNEKELGRFNFDWCLGKGRKDKFSIGQYFHSIESGRVDAVGLQITTAGEGVEAGIQSFKEQNDSESALYLRGLSDRVAEDMAEYIHQLLRTRAGYKKENRGQRYSPGYPALTSLEGNQIIWNVLGAEDLGITLTDANEFSPPSSTAAVICFHKDAGYS